MIICFFLFDQLLQRCWNALKACAHAGLKKKKKKKKKTKRLP